MNLSAPTRDRITWLACALGIFLSLQATPLLAQKPADGSLVKQDEFGRDYYIYTPTRIDPKKTYWLVVGVHGYGGDGKGAAGLSAWTKKGDCIVLGPSFPNQGYQRLLKQSDEQLVKLIESLSKQYKLHSKVFLYGFSGGAQFAHRFMMKYPQLVAGCSAHSAGSWATGEQWGAINPDATGIPFVMSCGEADTDKSTPDLPMGRFEWAKAFEKQLASAGFCFEARYWPKVGHAHSPGVQAMTEECYRLATQVIPAQEETVTAVRALLDAGKKQEASVLLSKANKPDLKASSALARQVAGRQKKALDELEQATKGVGQ